MNFFPKLEILKSEEIDFTIECPAMRSHSKSAQLPVSPRLPSPHNATHTTCINKHSVPNLAPSLSLYTADRLAHGTTVCRYRMLRTIPALTPVP